MANSTALITDIGTAITNGPSTTSVANANAAAGKIQDIPGNLVVAQLKLKEAQQLLTAIKADLDAGDGILTQVNNVLNVLV